MVFLISVHPTDMPFFVDATKVLTHVPKNEFPAQTLTVELYLKAVSEDVKSAISWQTVIRLPVRTVLSSWIYCAWLFPRRVYTDNHERDCSSVEECFSTVVKVLLMESHYLGGSPDASFSLFNWNVHNYFLFIYK